MTHVIVFGALTGREIAEFLKSTMTQDGTVGVRPTPSDAEAVVYQRSLTDPHYELTIEVFADGTVSRVYDGSRTEIRIEATGRGIRALATLLSEEFGGLVQVHGHWKAVPGRRADRLPPKAKLCIAVYSLFGPISRFPSAVHDIPGLGALKDSLDAYLAEHARRTGGERS